MSKQKALDIKKKEQNSSKAKKIIVPILSGILIFCIVIALGFWAYTKYYQDKIYPGVIIASFDVGGMNRENANVLIDQRIKKINAIGLNLTTIPKDKDFDLKYQDIGISVDKEKTLTQALSYAKIGNYWTQAKDFIKALIYTKNIPLVLKFDNKHFENAIKELMTDKLVEAKDASFDIKNDQIEIIQEQNGTAVDFDSLKKNIQDMINSENIYNTLVINTVPVQPKITSTDIASLTPKINSFLDKQITYLNDAYVYKPAKTDLAGWVEIRKNSPPEMNISDEGIRKYISAIAQKIDIKAKNKQIDVQNGNVISEGEDGRILNQEKAFIDTKNALTQGTNPTTIILEIQTIPKKEEKVNNTNTLSNGTPGLADGKYIEINLSTQTLYLFEGKDQKGSYTVSTGAWDTPTPNGTRSIAGKTERAWSEKYGLYMPYWNDVGGGYGIHELPEWPGGYKEGESHLGTPVSHGCIRLGVGAAQTVYDWAPIGTQVFIHQ